MSLRACSILAGAICLLTFGCSNPVTSSQQDDFFPQGWETIAILPFIGDERFADVSADEFTARLRTASGFRFIPPAEVAPTVRRLGVDIDPSLRKVWTAKMEFGITVADAQKVGRALNAEAVIVSRVVVLHADASSAVCLTQLIDVASGEIVASIGKSTGLRPTSSEKDCASIATAQAAKAMHEVLGELSRKNRPRTAPASE